jgi:glycosyltransferase involved in cell wall biosynthesis
MRDEIKNGISILIPTWNNFEYLKFCINSILTNSAYQHETILHINEGSDGTLDWAKENGFKFSYSNHNVGVCVAMNTAYKLATKNIIGFFNDDMVALPEWDKVIYEFCDKHKPHNLNLIVSSTMIEPRGHNDCCIAPLDFGQDLNSFRYNDLLADLDRIKTLKPDINGSTWPPNFMHRDLWERIGGYSEEFSPGYGSDPDIIKKAYDIGARNFVSLGKSLVYHFGSKTTGIKSFDSNDGERQFTNKHNITILDFVYNTLKRLEVFDNLKEFNN